MCDLISKNRGNKCSTAGGNAYVLFFNYVDKPFTVAAGVGTAINEDLTEVYKYAIVPKTSTLEAVKSVDASAGRGCVTTLSLQVRQTDSETNVELDAMGENTQCVVVDNTGQAKVVGYDDGFDTFTATLTNGDGTRNSFRGYTIEAVAETNNLPVILDSTTLAALIELIAE